MKGYTEILIYISLAFCSTVAQDVNGNPEVVDFANLELDEKLLRGSRWAIEQEQSNRKIEVFHAIDVVDMSRVDVDTMSVRIEIHLRQRWQSVDMKLPTELFQDDDSPETFIRADPKILDSLWSPDSFIPNARDTKVATLSTSQAVVNIFQNKTIIYKARLYTILGCNFNFQWYPLDKQVCDLTIESYTVPSHMVSYRWEDNIPPVTLSQLKLHQYEMTKPMYYTNGTQNRWGVGTTYPYVLLRFAFERQLGHNLIQVFIPTILVVILSWFSFWLGMDAIPGRISLLITCMLTLVTMHSGMKGAVPPVNYIKLMDVWMVVCMAFVFASLCEFIVVKYLHWRKQQELKAKTDKDAAMEKYMSKHSQGKDVPDSQKPFNPYLAFYDKGLLGSEAPYPINPIAMMQLHQRRSDKPRPAWLDYDGPPPMINPRGDLFNPGRLGQPVEKKPVWVIIDMISRIGFPLAFAIFNAAYWPYLIIGAANQ